MVLMAALPSKTARRQLARRNECCTGLFNAPERVSTLVPFSWRDHQQLKHPLRLGERTLRGRSPSQTDSKAVSKACNLLLLLANLYNFGCIDAVIFDLVRHLASNMSSESVEFLLVLLGRAQFRSDLRMPQGHYQARAAKRQGGKSRRK